jgi:hypothetical protein
MSIYDDGDDTADEDAENGSKGTETREDPPAPDPSETDENGRGATIDVSGLDLDGPPEDEGEAPSDDTGGVEETSDVEDVEDAEDAEDDGDDGGGLLMLGLIGAFLAWLFGRNGGNGGSGGTPPDMV